MAVDAAFAVLQLPHHGGTGNVLCGPDGDCGLPVMARKAVHDAMDPVAYPAQLSASLHCKHCGLDDGGDWPSAVAGVWADPNLGGRFLAHRRGDKPVYAAGFSGHVYRHFDPLDCAALDSDPEGPIGTFAR